MSIEPYQFEPKKIGKNKATVGVTTSDEEWEDVPEETFDSTEGNEEFAELVESFKRVDVDASEWCQCKNCKAMSVNRECLCCLELDDIKQKKITNG